MNRSTKTIIGVVLFVAIVLVAVGYAALSTVTLNISGTAAATVNTSNFSVEFTGTPTTSGAGNGKVVTATVNSTDKLKATLNVSGLNAKDDTVTATYTIKNTSKDLSATLGTPKITNNNSTYFSVTTSYGSATTLAASGTTTVTVTVKLLKTPIDTTENLSATIGVEITAIPVQP